jgi:hypothetical protein
MATNKQMLSSSRMLRRKLIKPLTSKSGKSTGAGSYGRPNGAPVHALFLIATLPVPDKLGYNR